MIALDIPQEWLTKKLVCGTSDLLLQTERDQKISEISSGFVNLWPEWKNFFGEIRLDDEIWEFDSPGDYWVSLCGRAGIALVRAGKPITGIVTEMN